MGNTPSRSVGHRRRHQRRRPTTSISTVPKIQINGEDSLEEDPTTGCPLSVSLSADGLNRRLKFISQSASLHLSQTAGCPLSASLSGDGLNRRLKFISQSASLHLSQTAGCPLSASLSGDGLNRRLKFISQSASLHLSQEGLPELEMNPLQRSRSFSPLRQLRRYSSSRSSPSLDTLFSDPLQREVITRTWAMVSANCTRFGRSFGFFVFDRIFTRQPELRAVFKLTSIYDLSDEDHFMQHARLFTNLINLAVRHLEELEAEMAPAFFSYGQRHYHQSSNIRQQFNEANVRMFASQVVCTVVDLLGDDLDGDGIEAWIELMRFIGSRLLDGFEHERLMASKKIEQCQRELFFLRGCQ